MKTTQHSLKICYFRWGSLLSSVKWIHWNEQHFCLTGNQTRGLRQMSQTALNTFLNNYKCCIRTADRKESHLPFLTKSVTHRRRMLWVVLSEETLCGGTWKRLGLTLPLAASGRRHGGRAAEVHMCSVFTISGRTSNLFQTGLLLNELENPDLGYLCSICVAGSDAQSRQSLKNDRGKKFPEDIKYEK